MMRCTRCGSQFPDDRNGGGWRKNQPGVCGPCTTGNKLPDAEIRRRIREQIIYDEPDLSSEMVAEATDKAFRLYTSAME